MRISDWSSDVCSSDLAGYFIEGHVPAADVKRLLATRPDAQGLTVPGMPIGSPGMEMPDGRTQPYAVELVKRDGTTEVYSRHGVAAGHLAASQQISEEHTYEHQSLKRISYDVLCFKK